MTSSNVALFVVAVLLFGTVVNSQSVYQQTYGQGVYSQYPRSPVSIWIIPIVLVVLVVILIPSLVGSSWIMVDKMKTRPPTPSTSIPTTSTSTMSTPSTTGKRQFGEHFDKMTILIYAVLVVALLFGTAVNSQSVYQQTYGQGVYSQYPRAPC
uniref:Transmembrane protein n=1 Tax=Magallana gigas TaxID=29159 RepID=A0A8W8KJU7_MAGGI